MDSASNSIFGYGERIAELRASVRRFIDQEAIPRERPELAHDVAALDAVLAELRPIAQRAGIYGPQLPPSLGGLGLNWRDRSVVLEEAGRSFLGAGALNCAPPDQPNMISLIEQGSHAQRARWLAPLASGAIRSCFAMTEPHPGAGSDPSMLSTRAERRAGGWVLNGRKWFISGAVGARFAIVLAMTDTGATQFLVEADNPGFRVVRNIAGIDGFQIGGHGEIELVDCAVGDDDALGEIGKGFEYAQVRLERRARLALHALHRPRVAGDGDRAALRVRAAVVRPAFVRPAAGAGDGRGFAHRPARGAADDLALRGADGRGPVGEARVVDDQGVRAEAVYRVADRAAQIMGALGMSDDTPVSMIVRELRPFRIYDGASELHRATLARRVLKGGIAP